MDRPTPRRRLSPLSPSPSPSPPPSPRPCPPLPLLPPRPPPPRTGSGSARFGRKASADRDATLAEGRTRAREDATRVQGRTPRVSLSPTRMARSDVTRSEGCQHGIVVCNQKKFLRAHGRTAAVALVFFLARFVAQRTHNSTRPVEVSAFRVREVFTLDANRPADVSSPRPLSTPSVHGDGASADARPKKRVTRFP